MNELMHAIGNALSPELAKNFEISRQGHLRLSNLGADPQYTSGSLMACDYHNRKKVSIIDVKTANHVNILSIEQNYTIKALSIIQNGTHCAVWAAKDDTPRREWLLLVYEMKKGTCDMKTPVRLDPETSRSFINWSICDTGRMVYICDSGDISENSVIVAADIATGQARVHYAAKIKKPGDVLQLIPVHRTDTIIGSTGTELLVIDTKDMSLNSRWKQPKPMINVLTAYTRLEAAIWDRDRVYIADIAARRTIGSFLVHDPKGSLAMFYSEDDRYLTVLNTSDDTDYIKADVIHIQANKIVWSSNAIQKDHVDEQLCEQMQIYGFATHTIDCAYQFLYYQYYFATCDYVHFFTDIVYCKQSNKIGVFCRNGSGDSGMGKAVVLIDIKTLETETFLFPDTVSCSFLALRENHFAISYVENNDPLPSYCVIEIWNIRERRIVEKIKSPWWGTGDNWTEERARKMFCRMLKHEAGISRNALASLESIRAYNSQYFIAFANEGLSIQLFDRNFELLDTASLRSKAVMAAFSNNDHAFYIADEAKHVRRYEIRNEHIDASAKGMTCRFTNEKFPESYFHESADGRYICIRNNTAGPYTTEFSIYDTQLRTFVNSSGNPMWDACYNSVFDQDMRIRINQLPYAGVIRFHDALTYEELVTLKLFRHSRILWQTPPDSVAHSGWIYTNQPEKLGVYSETPNGSVEMLKPGDTLREEYIHNHSRPDIIRKRLKEGAGGGGIGSLKTQLDLNRALGRICQKSLPEAAD